MTQTKSKFDSYSSSQNRLENLFLDLAGDIKFEVPQEHLSSNNACTFFVFKQLTHVTPLDCKLKDSCALFI